MYSIAILAGGQSLRMGENKALINVGGLPVLQRVINSVSTLSSDIFLVTNTPQVYASFRLPIVTDAIPGKAALGGIYTALLQAKHNWTFVVACDMPLLDSRIISLLAERRQGADVVAPLITPHPETLHTFYNKKCLQPIHNCLMENRLKITCFFNEVNVSYVKSKAFLKIASNLDFLINLNTPEDLARIRERIKDR